MPTQQFYGTAGFWGWQAMSPFSPAADIANDWLGALGSTVALQSAKNETLGLPWADSGDAPDWKRLFDRRDDSYVIGTVPDGVLFLTAGADVQTDRIEVQVIGWGRGRRSWLVDYIVLNGDTSRHEVWSDLTKILGTLYQHPRGVDIAIRKIAVDSGYATQQVYEWARLHRFGPVAVVKGGADTQSAPVAAPSPVDITHHGKKIASGVKVQLLNTGHFKAELYGILRLDTPNFERGEDYPDGWFTICALSDTEEYCRQITGEQLITKKDNRGYVKRQWEKVRARNEALDTWVYARAAAYILGIDRYQDSHWREIEQSLGMGMTAPTPKQEDRQQESPAGNERWVRDGNDKRGGWFGDKRGGGWFR